MTTKTRTELKPSHWKSHLGSWAKYAAAAGAALSMATGADAGSVTNGTIVSDNANKTSPFIASIKFGKTNPGTNQSTVHAGFGLPGAIIELRNINAGSTRRIDVAEIGGVHIFGGAGGLLFNQAGRAALKFAYSQNIAGTKLGNPAFLNGGSTRSGRTGAGLHGHQGNFGFGTTGIVGFTYNNGDKGWMTVKIGENTLGWPDQLQVISWAYNDVAGAAITAGETSSSTTPEPGTAALGLLAAGAAGILALRRRRKEVQPH